MIVTALADDGRDGERARDRLSEDALAAPHLIDIEVISAWRRLVAAGDLDERRARLAMADLSELRIVRAAHLPLLERCWELRPNLTTYDAAYVALSEALGTSLLTLDERIARAPGVHCKVEVLR